MSVRVAVITPHLPERRKMLGELQACLEAQTRPPDVWIVIPDYDRVGATRNANRCLAAAMAEGVDYILPFSDDNLMDRDHIETLLAHKDKADIVYSRPRVTGRDDGWFEEYVNGPFDRERLDRESYIDVSALYDVSVFEDVGTWSDARGYPDWDLFKRADDFGFAFHQIPRKTWTYRFGHGNVSMGGA